MKWKTVGSSSREDDVVHFHTSRTGDEVFALRLRRLPDDGAEVELCVTAEVAEMSVKDSPLDLERGARRTVGFPFRQGAVETQPHG